MDEYPYEEVDQQEQMERNKQLKDILQIVEAADELGFVSHDFPLNEIAEQILGYLEAQANEFDYQLRAATDHRGLP